MIKLCNRIIEYSFYSLFLLVPLVFTSSTSELFEFNKMWLTFGITLIIAGAWITKSILQKRILLCRTPLDIPILIFVASQLISTIFSLDSHISIWGYYSRFNGGFLSILSYIFLYYAFLSNFFHTGSHNQTPETIPAEKIVKRLLMVSLASGLIVALWGLPSHFGYDPTCLLFRGTFDVTCWTEAFQPKVRIFSTLGQPDWLAAYLAILIPISVAFAIKNSKSETPASTRGERNPKQILNPNDKNQKGFGNLNFGNLKLFRVSIFDIRIYKNAICYLLFATLFYVDIIYTDARSGFVGIWSALLTFAGLLLWNQKKSFKNFSFLTSPLILILTVFVFITFIVGTPIHQLDKFTFSGIKTFFEKPAQTQTAKPAQAPAQSQIVVGGTESTKIRQIVWKGAIDAWKNNLLFGTGVETFAFAYYKYRPVEHNMVSEWDYLYNKAHNEYLNYLATTGAFGLGTYLLMIGGFLWISIKQILRLETRNSKLEKEVANSKLENQSSNFKPQNLTSSFQNLTSIALLASYLSILVTNFFGFSVVITNIYLFMIPAFVFILNGMIDPQKSFVFPKPTEKKLSTPQWFMIIILLFAIFYLLFNLFRFWQADKSYALGYNLDRINDYQQAYPKLHEAVATRGDEPVFKDELSLNNAVLAAALFSQKETSTAAVLTTEAIAISDELAANHPNNVVFAKTRVRMFYTLAQVDKQYLPYALSAIQKANVLAPTDAKISYNMGIITGQSGNTNKAVEILQNTTRLKPDYRDAYYALGLFYHDLAVDAAGRVIKPEFEQKAISTLRYLISLYPQDDQAKQILQKWGK